MSLRGIFTCIIILTQLSLLAQSQKVSSNISEITVYQQGAEISRTVSLSLTPGHNAFTINGLSGGIDPNSIRIANLGGAKISFVNLERDYLSEIAIPNNIKNTLEEYEDTKLKLNIRQRVLTAYSEEKKLLLANQKVLGENSNLQVEDLVKLADLYRSRLKEIELKSLEISDEIETLQEEIKRLSNQLGTWKNLPNQSQNTLELGLSSLGPQNIKLTVSYLVYNASWTPTYDVIATDELGNIDLVYKANIQQSTGINWDKVAVNVSTGAPLRQGTLPEIYPEYVQIVDPNLGSTRAYLKERTTMEVAAADKLKYGDYEASEQVNANVVTLFEVASKHSISTYAKPVAIALNTLKLKADLNFLAIPKKSGSAFLQAQLTGYEAGGLLPGKANTYYQGNLTGSTYIDPNSSSAALNISLGRDPQISLERKAVNDVSRDGNLITSNKKSFHYEITVKNNKDRSIQLTLKDQIPLSKNTDIEVVNEELSGGSLNTNTGEVTWDINLNSGASKTIALKYSIKFPKGKQINR